MQTASEDGMTDAQLLRYSRHILLDDVGIEGQQKILNSHALVIGAGGLGSPVLMYLASAGVGHITVVDDDMVALTNLQRQIAHTHSSVGTAKVTSAARTMAAINPEVQVTALQLRASAHQLDALVAQADVVLDCCDNFATRHAVNAACVQYKVPLVSGAAIQFDGQISVHDLRLPQAPCYACIFPADPAALDAHCATMGVFAPLVGIIGSMQAAEALKLIVKLGTSLSGRLQILDARNMEWTALEVHRDAACKVCATCKPHTHAQ